eukprot:TRINITY_DN3591_c0_g1_i5.p1 TRINITY_DN3591_c0_g1~~TRINITY_DN3591_c0_g1_i5.p1  ORF type:complete len:369 (-),score=30.63 TRINITY_DN3591_c0_g1_i5:7-1080(-)
MAIELASQLDTSPEWRRKYRDEYPLYFHGKGLLRVRILEYDMSIAAIEIHSRCQNAWDGEWTVVGNSPEVIRVARTQERFVFTIEIERIARLPCDILFRYMGKRAHGQFEITCGRQTRRFCHMLARSGIVKTGNAGRESNFPQDVEHWGRSDRIRPTEAAGSADAQPGQVVDTLTAHYISAGTVIAGQFLQMSDENLKRIITSYDSAAYELVNQKLHAIGVYLYQYRSDIEKGVCEKHIGFMAQEVQKIFPTLVSEIDGYLAVDYVGMVPILVMCIRDLDHKYSSLKQEVEAVKENQVLLRTEFQELRSGMRLLPADRVTFPTVIDQPEQYYRAQQDVTNSSKLRRGVSSRVTPPNI